MRYLSQFLAPCNWDWLNDFLVLFLFYFHFGSLQIHSNPRSDPFPLHQIHWTAFKNNQFRQIIPLLPV